MNVLFYDIQVTGHHTEYINHILNFLVENNDENVNYYFVVHQNFLSNYNHIATKASGIENISFIEVEINKLKNLNVSNRFRRSFNNFNLVDSYARSLNIDVCYLLHMNVFQIALGFKKIPYKVRGILFMQFTNMKIRSLKDYYHYLRRFLPMLLCKNNKNIEAIYLLNDKMSCELLNKKFKKENVFRHLADPIPQIVPDKNFSIIKNYGLEPNTKIFLHFGAISKRKGIMEIIEATKLIDKNIQDKIVVLIVGKTSDPVLEIEIIKKIDQMSKITSVKLIWENDFVSEKKMATLFDQCDYVLMPYKNAEASSGILGHAMYAKKPVIGPANGLIGGLIKKYKMGVVLKNITASEIANAINKYETIACNEHYFNTFVNEHTPTNFVKTLLCP